VRPVDGRENAWRRSALLEEPFGRSALRRARDDDWFGPIGSAATYVVDLGPIGPTPISRPFGVFPGDEPVDWDNIPFLSELIDRGPTTPTTLPELPAVEAASSWLEVQFVDPWWRPFTGMTVELELPNGDLVRRGLDGEARVRIDALAGPRRPCRAWLPADAAVPRGASAGVRPAAGETGRARRGGAPIELPLETHNVIIVEVPHVPSW
jgi:hypothetical protein